MEIGSFIELEFPTGKDYFHWIEQENIARLNSGRAAIWHAYRGTGCKAIWLPVYQCDSVREFLIRKNVPIKYYHMDEKFDPIDLSPKKNEAVLFVNYFGVMGDARLEGLVSQYPHVILDHSQGFFSKPNMECFNVYSARKFIGVPDGAYVIGPGASKYTETYEQGFSSDTSQFLLERIEYGCEGKAYESRMRNEHRIDQEDIRLMSNLTRTILNATNYKSIIRKREANYIYAGKLFDQINQVNLHIHEDCMVVPMVYPLVIEDDQLLDRLLEHKHFQGHWWSYILEEEKQNSFEYYLSRYLIPITIDQRYGREELDYIRNLCK